MGQGNVQRNATGVIAENAVASWQKQGRNRRLCLELARSAGERETKTVGNQDLRSKLPSSIRCAASLPDPGIDSILVSGWLENILPFPKTPSPNCIALPSAWVPPPPKSSTSQQRRKCCSCRVLMRLAWQFFAARCQPYPRAHEGPTSAEQLFLSRPQPKKEGEMCCKLAKRQNPSQPNTPFKKNNNSQITSSQPICFDHLTLILTGAKLSGGITDSSRPRRTR